MSVFWDRFNSLSKAKDGSPNKTAQILGLSSGSVTAWSRGTLPASKTVLKIAEYFNVTTNYMYGIETSAPNGAPVVDENLKAMLEIWHTLSEENKDKALDYAALLVGRESSQK